MTNQDDINEHNAFILEIARHALGKLETPFEYYRIINQMRAEIACMIDELYAEGEDDA